MIVDRMMMKNTDGVHQTSGARVITSGSRRAGMEDAQQEKRQWRSAE